MSIFGFSAFAQSAEVITEILEAKEVTYGQISYLSAVHQNLISETDSYEDAVKALYDNKQIPALYDVTESIPVVNAVYIFSHMWNIKGGLMYKLTNGAPRYVFRQFQTDGIIGASVEPKSHFSGAAALSMYTSCLRKYGSFDITSVSMGEE